MEIGGAAVPQWHVPTSTGALHLALHAAMHVLSRVWVIYDPENTHREV